MCDTRKINHFQTERYNSSVETNRKAMGFFIEVLDSVSQKDRIRILDIGGGNGVFAQMIADYFPQKDINVTVLDNAAYKMVENGRGGGNIYI